MAVSGWLKLTELGVNMTPQKRLQQLAHAEGHHSDKGYQLGTQAEYEAFVAKRNHATPYNPDADVRELGKWLNEEPNREINRPALARILAYLQ